jgi:hypothetical protein
MLQWVYSAGCFQLQEVKGFFIFLFLRETPHYVLFSDW